MRAEYLDDGTVAVSGATRVQTFERIWAGIGWPDLDPGYICVVGERTDGRYHALWEKQGGLWELGSAAVEAKDSFLVECVVVDTRDELATSYLRTLDGLCFHAEPSRKFGRVTTYSASGLQQSDDSPAVTTVTPVQERVLTSYRTALERTRGLMMTGKLLVHELNCPRMVYTLRQPLEQLLMSPVMKGLVWVLIALENSSHCTMVEHEMPEPWYGNLSRNSK